MDSKLKAMSLLLDRMDVLYERVFEILTRERRCMIEMDFETLMTEMREKDEVVSALRGLDRDRLRIQDQFAIIMGVDPEELTLRALAEALIEQGASSREVGMKLMEQRNRLGSTVEKLRQKIEANSSFIERSIENLQGIASNYTATVTGRPGRLGRAMAVYDKKAKYQQGDAPTGTLVEKRL